MVELYCPNCMKPLQVLHDDRHDETYCRNCGIILRCPPSAEIITPKIIISDKEEGETDKGDTRVNKQRCGHPILHTKKRHWI